MADPRRSLAENVPGEFFVDESCIDCETCMIVAPQVFAESGRSLSYVHHQPSGSADLRRAQMALIACPTASIGTLHKVPGGAEAAKAFPEEILPGVWYCGYASEDSFGASSYLIRREAGNVLVDSPRAAAPLLNRIEELGGAKLLFLTHRDDVADHEKLHARFGCERVIHAADAGHLPVERRIEGTEPVSLAEDLTAIPVPGHTRGSACLLFRDVLFTGDHLWGDERGHLSASRGVAWFSWKEQTRSMDRLLEVGFRAVLPGHGRPWIGESVAQAREELSRLVGRMKAR